VEGWQVVTGDSLRVTDGIGATRVAGPSTRVVPGGMAGSPGARPGMGIGDVPPFVLQRRPAACARPGIDPRWFMPSYREDPNNWPTVERARRICQGCPVLFECRTWAVGVKGLEGMWGATTPEERKQLRRTP
jgi:WhiB family redox-sensing transcriptional regulator